MLHLVSMSLGIVIPFILCVYLYLFIFHCSCRLVFPTVLVLYQVVVAMSNILIKETLLLLNSSLLCNSLDLIENMSQGQSTVFCPLSGNFTCIYCNKNRTSTYMCGLLGVFVVKILLCSATCSGRD